MPASRSRNTEWRRSLQQVMEKGGGLELAIARSAPDGYNMVVSGIASHVLAPLLSKLPYDPVTSFAPVTMLASLPLIMTVNADLKVNSLAEFLALARERPGRLAFASSGNGGAPHMAGELLKGAASIDMLRASKTALKNKNIPVGSKLFVTGYSQGGHAAAATSRSVWASVARWRP